MKHLSLFAMLTIIQLVMLSALNAQTAIETSLFLMEDIVFKSIKSPEGYGASYELRIRQPFDHEDPGAGHFYQKVYLNHKDFNAPVVIVTEGYDRPKNRLYELSNYMEANQIQIEHRFYGASKPDSIPYEYLNLKQMSADIHRINQLFRKIYLGPYVSTGISKGGMSTLFYRYFYPDDVDVSVPYVAPINIALKDDRIYSFLDEVGDASCRHNIEDFQKHLLENKDVYMPLLKWYNKGKNVTFDRLTLEGAYEFAVLEYSFSFWQYGTQCDDIPDRNDDQEAILEHFIAVSGLDFFGDGSLGRYEAFYYQMGTEMGYYGYDTEAFEHLLSVVDQEPSAVFSPKGLESTFNGQLTNAAHQWMTEELEKVIYINGALDTWSATAIDPSDHLDALVFNLEGRHHANARIRSMNNEERLQLKETLERWLNIEVADALPYLDEK